MTVIPLRKPESPACIKASRYQLLPGNDELKFSTINRTEISN